MAEQYCEAFVRLMELGFALGVRDINKLPGCWELQVDDNWWIAVNAGHDTPIECSHRVMVDPFVCYVEFNDFPAGFFNAAGGTIAAGEAANERSFIQALKDATERASGATT